MEHPIAYSSQNFDTFADGTLTLRAAALPPPGPATYQVPADAAPTGLRQGQSLVLGAGGQLGENFTAAWGSSVTITGGNVAKNFEAVGATVAISGGFVTSSFDAFRGSVVNVTGGTVSGIVAQAGSVVNVSGGTVSIRANDGSVVNVSGGTVGNGAVAENGGVMNISGGTIGNNFKAASGGVVNLSHGSVGNSADALAGSVFNMYGGTVGTDFDADALSSVTLFGTQFILNGVNITNTLPYNTPTLITNRNVPLTGLLADNSAFAFDLYSTNASARDYFASTAALMVTRVLPGDFSRDGMVNAADYVTYRNGFGTLYSQLDYTLWRSNFGQTAGSGGSLNAEAVAAIPEPSALAIVIAGILAMLASTAANRFAGTRLTRGAAHRHNYG